MRIVFVSQTVRYTESIASACTLNVYQSKPALYTWLDRKNHCELGKKMLMAKQECIRSKKG